MWMDRQMYRQTDKPTPIYPPQTQFWGYNYVMPRSVSRSKSIHHKIQISIFSSLPYKFPIQIESICSRQM